MDNQDKTGTNSQAAPNDPTIVAPIQNGGVPNDVSEEDKVLQELQKLKNEERTEELADAKKVEEREEEFKKIEEAEKKDPKLILTESSTPPTDKSTADKA